MYTETVLTFSQHYQSVVMQVSILLWPYELHGSDRRQTVSRHVAGSGNCATHGNALCP